MTLSELQAAGRDWRTKPQRVWSPPPTTPIADLANRSWNAHLAKENLRLAVELAHISGVPLEQLAEELKDELGNYTMPSAPGPPRRSDDSIR